MYHRRHRIQHRTGACSGLSKPSPWILSLLLLWALPCTTGNLESSFEVTMQTARHPPLCSLLWSTPACAALSVQRPHRPAAVSGCGLETCSVDRSSQTFAAVPAKSVNARQQRDVSARAQVATTSTETQKWWKKQSELWVDVHTEEDFHREINSGDKLVFVGEYHIRAFSVHPIHCLVPLNHVICCPCADFFATWCNGCQRSYPELCKLAMDPELNKQIKFVKVCKHTTPSSTKCIHLLVITARHQQLGTVAHLWRCDELSSSSS